jgi:signal transduction histidine kinase
LSIKQSAAAVPKRFLISLLLSGVVALITLVTWKLLIDHHHAQVARIAESESYAARSQLIRNVDKVFRALRDTRDYWARNGHLPRNEWAAEPGIELANLEGIRLILWNDPMRGIRFARTGNHPVLDYRPRAQEWMALEDLDRKARQVTRETILGPYADDDGTVSYEICLPVADAGREPAYLLAVVDSQESFGRLLLDESPGYAISVFWNDVLLFRRGEAAAGLPESWAREGMIRTSLGSLWRVVHQPTRELAESHNTPALTAVLWSGLAIAVLVGLLLFENGRAESRATAAESAERKLADLNHDLEQQIAERVRELADRTADLETITDSVAHDLRNPLNSISVNSQLLQQQFRNELGEEGLAALQRTTSSVKRMTEILDRLLGLSVVSHSIFEREEIDIRTIVTEVFEELNSTEQEPPVELVAEDLPKASADPVLVRTLIMNLISNAIKYTREKPLRRIEVGSLMEDGVDVFCVRDNGIGFEPESAEKMFRAFERLGGNGEKDGVGLGLDIAARVVTRHGGRIWAEGRRGQGAAIYFTLTPPRDEWPS